MTARAAEAEAWIRSIERRTAEVGDGREVLQCKLATLSVSLSVALLLQLEECAVRCGRCGGWATLPALLAGAGVCPNRACGRPLEAFRSPQQQPQQLLGGRR